MTLVLKDRVKEQTTTTGTGTVTLGGAVSGFEAFSAVGDGNTTYYAIVHQTADEWEVGLGTYTAAGTLLSRDTILESTNSDAAVNFSAGTKDVFVTYPSDKAIYADGSGNVGIGTSSPDAAAKLDVNGQVLVRSTGAAPDTTPGGQYGFYIQPDSTGTVNLMSYSSGGSTDIQFFTNSGGAAAVNAMTIDSSGNVGIGVTPTYRLEIGGVTESIFRNTGGSVQSAVYSSGGGSQGQFGTFSAHPTVLITGGTEKVRIDSSGNVGIGTSSPGTPLHVEGAAAANNLAIRVINTDTSGWSTIQMGGTDAGIYRNGSAQTSYGGASSLNLITVGAHPIAFSTGNTPRVIIDSSGNVGIGTNSPNANYAQTIVGNLAIGSGSAAALGGENFIVTDGTTTGKITLGGGPTVQFGSKSNHPVTFFVANGEKVRIDSSGNVLIGTTTNPASQRMAVLGGGVQFSGGTSAQEGLRIQRASGYASITGINNDNNAFNAISFFTSGTAALHITTGNNVGIGTTNPGDKLDVVGGNVRIASTNEIRWVDSGTIRGTIEADGSGNLIFGSAGGSEAARFTSSGDFEMAATYGPALRNVSPSATVPSILVGKTDTDTGLGSPTGDNLSLITGGVEAMRIDGNRDTDFIGGGVKVSGSLSTATTNSIALDQAGSVSRIRTFGPSVGNAVTIQFEQADSAGTPIRYPLVIDSSGNVGIGTTPSRKLEVLKSGVDDVNIALIGGGSGAGGSSVAVGAYGTSSYIRGVNNGVSGYTPLNVGGSVTVLETNGSEKMRIDSSGNVGIGTSSPTGGYKLDVVGAIGGPSASFTIYPSPGVSAKRTLSLSNNANATLHLDHDGGYNRFGCDSVSQHFAFCAGGSTAGNINVVFKGDGNVGIGTTSPAKQFEITKASRALIGTLTDGATITPDFDANQNFTVTLGGNRTLANPTNVDAGQTGSIFVVQDATGGRTLSFGSYWKFAGGTAPTLSTGTNAVDRIDYIVKSSTEIHAVASLNLS